jgi:hypothetical protein
MTSFSTGPKAPKAAAESDVYTALLCVAFLALLAATIYVGYRAMTLFGGLLPPGGG